jgi:hypothetical protein
VWRNDIACLCLGFDFLERALGYHGCDPIEQPTQHRELQAQGQPGLLDAGALISESSSVERIGAPHRSTPHTS